MKRKWLTALIIYAALLILCLVVIYAVPSIRGLLEQTYITEVGTVSINEEISGYIVRDEHVYLAGKDSKINRLAEANKLVKAGSAVVELTSTEKADAADEEDEQLTGKYASIVEDLDGHYRTTNKGKIKDSGYVSYYVDGQEYNLSTENLDGFSEKELQALTDKKLVETPKKNCSAGEPVFKIVDNSKWYLVFFTDKKSADKYVEGRTITIDIGGAKYPAKVSYIDSSSKKSKVVLTCKMFFDGFLEMRTMDATLTLASAQGLVIEDRSIIEKDGQKGVLIKNKLGEHRFRPISIMADDGENCVVYSDIYVDEGGNFVETVSAYDEIIAEPSEEEVKELNKKK